MTQVSSRIDDQLKADDERLFNSMGMNMSVAITMFIQQSLQRGKLTIREISRRTSNEKLGLRVHGTGPGLPAPFRPFNTDGTESRKVEIQTITTKQVTDIFFLF